MKRPRIALGAAVLAAALAAPAVAHHSAAMFDRDKQVTLVGTVKEFQWTNPHSWIQLNVPDAEGKVVEWSIELGGPSALFRQGWRANSLAPGESVTLVINPLRNGNPGGNLRSATKADGTRIGEGS